MRENEEMGERRERTFTEARLSSAVSFSRVASSSMARLREVG